jgi:hypothetical protein
MNYSQYDFRAVVDWIELEIQTEQPTHFDAIRRRIWPSYVKEIDPAPKGKSATIFRFTIYDPANWHDVLQTIDTIAQTFSLAKPFKVVGIEVALDAYGRGEVTSEELASVAAHFAKFTTHTHENRRIYRETLDGVFALPLDFAVVVTHLVAGWQIGVGDKLSDCYQHIYFKTTDHNKRPLPVNLHRARIEITLRGDKLPCQTLEEWSGCSFAKLAKPYFSFRKLNDEYDLTPPEVHGAKPVMDFRKLIKRCSDQMMDFGKRKQNKTPKGMRLFRPASKADRALGDIARYKLRELSDRWRRQQKVQNKSIAYGNTGDADPATPNSGGKSLTDSNNYI